MGTVCAGNETAQTTAKDLGKDLIMGCLSSQAGASRVENECKRAVAGAQAGSWILFLANKGH